MDFGQILVTSGYAILKETFNKNATDTLCFNTSLLFIKKRTFTFYKVLRATVLKLFCSLMLQNHQLFLWNAAAAAESNHSQSTLVITHSISCPTVDLSLVLIRTSLVKRAFTFTSWQWESSKLKAIYVSISKLHSY